MAYPPRVRRFYLVFAIRSYRAKRACRTSHSIHDRRFHYFAEINWPSNGWEFEFIVARGRMRNFCIWQSHVLFHFHRFGALLCISPRSYTIPPAGDLSRRYQYLVGVRNDHINIERQLYSLPLYSYNTIAPPFDLRQKLYRNQKVYRRRDFTRWIVNFASFRPLRYADCLYFIVIYTHLSFKHER